MRRLIYAFGMLLSQKSLLFAQNAHTTSIKTPLGCPSPLPLSLSPKPHPQAPTHSTLSYPLPLLPPPLPPLPLHQHRQKPPKIKLGPQTGQKRNLGPLMTLPEHEIA